MSTLPDITCPLTETEAETAFGTLLDGAPSEDEIEQFLVALSKRGETSNEIAGAARALRARLIPINAPDNAIDVCARLIHITHENDKSGTATDQDRINKDRKGLSDTLTDWVFHIRCCRNVWS